MNDHKSGTLLIFFFAFVSCCVAFRDGPATAGAELYELRKGDFVLKVTNLGATVVSVSLPDSQGHVADVALGFDSLSSYSNDTTYFGATVGRVANRIGGAQFSLNGTLYKLVANEGKNTLHGGKVGFSKVLWTVKNKTDGETPSITFNYNSFDGEQGFPGDLDVYVTYKILDVHALLVNMQAIPKNKATPVNLAQHTYWNLGGHDSGDILSHKVAIYASHYTPVDKSLIPTGEILPVAGTPFDFRHTNSVGENIEQAGGYDLNYVLDQHLDERRGLRKVAKVSDPKSGRVMQLWTNAPGVQFYTSNGLNDVKGKGGYVYKKYGGLCLETQGFPDSVNHPNFPSQIVNPGDVYKHTMLFKFTVMEKEQ